MKTLLFVLLSLPLTAQNDFRVFHKVDEFTGSKSILSSSFLYGTSGQTMMDFAFGTEGGYLVVSALFIGHDYLLITEGNEIHFRLENGSVITLEAGWVSDMKVNDDASIQFVAAYNVSDQQFRALAGSSLQKVRVETYNMRYDFSPISEMSPEIFRENAKAFLAAIK